MLVGMCVLRTHNTYHVFDGFNNETRSNQIEFQGNLYYAVPHKSNLSSRPEDKWNHKLCCFHDVGKCLEQERNAAISRNRKNRLISARKCFQQHQPNPTACN